MPEYSNTPLPSQKYLALLGKALYIFNNSNAYIIEKILHCNSDDYSWADLIDRNSGGLRLPIKRTIVGAHGDRIAALFEKLVTMRNRIAHSYQIKGKDEKPVLVARDNKTGHITVLDTTYLEKFIQENERFVTMLDNFHGC